MQLCSGMGVSRMNARVAFLVLFCLLFFVANIYVQAFGSPDSWFDVILVWVVLPGLILAVWVFYKRSDEPSKGPDSD